MGTCELVGKALSLFHLNVTCWGPLVLGLFTAPSFDIALLCETHLLAPAALATAKRDLSRLGFCSHFHPATATDSDDQVFPAEAMYSSPECFPSRFEDPAVANAADVWQSARRTRAGCAIVWKHHLAVEPLPGESLSLLLPSIFLRSRILPMMLRCRSVTYLLLEVYLITGLGLSGANWEILEAISVLIRFSDVSGSDFR